VMGVTVVMMRLTVTPLVSVGAEVALNVALSPWFQVVNPTSQADPQKSP